MRALDLCCKAGGASRGLADAGFDVSGVDIEPQPNYPFAFTRCDALEAKLDGVDFVWASPPCQGFTAYKRRSGHVRPRKNIIPELRARLCAWGGPFVIENVPGAPLNEPVVLCGSMFGLDVRRHRLFEATFSISPPPCRHELQAPRFPPATNRKNLRRTVEVGVCRIPLKTQLAAMGLSGADMTLAELSNAVPPAYSEFIARQFLSQREAA